MYAYNILSNEWLYKKRKKFVVFIRAYIIFQNYGNVFILAI